MATENIERSRGKTEHHVDVSLWFALLFLLCFGLVMIYSASSYTAFADYGDQMYYLKRQAVAAGLGLVAMMFVSRIPYHFWERFSLTMSSLTYSLYASAEGTRPAEVCGCIR